MKLGFFGLLSLFLVEMCSSLTSATIIEDILDSVKNIESLMQDSCRPNSCCSSSRSRARKGFVGRNPYEFSGFPVMKSMSPPGFNLDRMKYIEQNILRLQKMKSRLEAEQLKGNKENKAGAMKGPLRSGLMNPKSSVLSDKSKVLITKKNTNVNQNVNTNAMLAGKKVPEKKLARSALPTINPAILTVPPVKKMKNNVEKKIDKNVNANTNTNVNTVNRLMDYDLFGI